ncbi:MAG: MFS transporter [Gemmataceae bacterium]
MNDTNAALARPTRYRYGVLALACSLSMITYLDRACFGTAAVFIREALGFESADQLALAFTAFSLAYALFEVPTGWLGDVFGPRKTLIRIVLWWSLFTGLSALAGLPIAGTVLVTFPVLVAIRFLFGIGEAGAYPNITRALHNWFPVAERGSAQGMVWMSGRLMGGLTPVLWWLLVIQLQLSWRGAFLLFAVLGVVWCVVFTAFFRNRPAEHPGVNDRERQEIEAGSAASTEAAHANVPWGRLVTSPNLWALCLMYFAMSYPWYFNINYLPAYLEEMHDVSPKSSLGAFFKGGPLILGAVGCLVGGRLTDAYVQRTGDRRRGRKLFGMLGHAMCIPLYLACLVAPNAWVFAITIALAGFCNDLAMGSAWATCQDVGRRHAAIVAGCMNMIGNLGGAASSYVIGWLLGLSKARYLAANGIADESFKALPAAQKAAALLPGYDWNFWTFAGMYVLALVFWLVVDATKPVVPEDDMATSG